MPVDPKRGARGGRLTWEEKRAVRTLIAKGVRRGEVAERVVISIRSVDRIIAEAGGMAPSTDSANHNALTYAEREEILLGLHHNQSYRAIGDRLSRSHTTISREVERNGGRDSYQAWRAARETERRSLRPKPVKLETNTKLRTYVIVGLHKKWSPEEIAGRLLVDHPDDAEMRVSHETIYRWLYVHCERELKAELIKAMRSPRPMRTPRGRVPKGTRRFDADQMIKNRPTEIDERILPGHWEGDLICGTQNKSAIATLVERTTLFTVLVQTGERHDAVTVRERMTERIKDLPEQVWLSLTWDQGAEMADHAQFSIDTGIDVYFCDPHAPWQRGLNENTNGLLRQYFPKGTDLSVHSQDWLDHVAAELNDRPRKTLGYRKPAEALDLLLT
jgi:transposase, IS30 family